jgi:hypothetical protein
VRSSPSKGDASVPSLYPPHSRPYSLMPLLGGSYRYPASENSLLVGNQHLQELAYDRYPQRVGDNGDQR